MKKDPIEIFSQWALTGKDKGMEKNHALPVKEMLEFSIEKLNNFSFVDAGCGNGWVVRNVSKFKNCIEAIGIDGSKK